MKHPILAAIPLFLSTATWSSAQLPPNLAALRLLADSFPTFTVLEATHADHTLAKISWRPDMASRGAPGDPEQGRMAALSTAILNNLKFHTDLTYTRTIARSLEPGTTILAPFALSGVKYIPTVSVIYEANLGQAASALNQLRKSGGLAHTRQEYLESEAQKLRLAYSGFEKLRADFRDAISPAASAGPLAGAASPAGISQPKNICSKFYEMKGKAIEVLSMAVAPGDALHDWSLASCNEH